MASSQVGRKGYSSISHTRSRSSILLQAGGSWHLMSVGGNNKYYPIAINAIFVKRNAITEEQFTMMQWLAKNR
jgi:hypothetical protein